MQVVFKANPKQKQALVLLTDNVTTSLGYGGAAGGGKSFLGVYWIWMMADCYPKTRWFFGRNELKRLKQTTLETFFKMCGEYGIPMSAYNYNAQESVITLKNGSQIFLLDLAYQPSDPLYQRFGSMEFTGGFIDESAEVKASCIDILKTRIGRQLNDKYGLTPKLLETFNPDKGHVYTRFYKPHVNGTLPEYTKFITALPTDEPRLPQDYIEQLRRADEITKQRLLYGNFEYDDDPAILFDRNHLDRLFHVHHEDPDDLWLTVDVARKGDDKTVYGLWHGFQLVEVTSKDKTLITEIIEDVLQLETKHDIPRGQVVIDEDGVGGGVVDNLSGCKGFVNNAKPEQWMRNEQNSINYENRKTQCYYEMARMVAHNRVGVSDTQYQEEIIQELDQVRQRDADKDTKLKITKKEDIKENIGRSPDFADMMAMRFAQKGDPHRMVTDWVYTPRPRNPAY